MDCMRSLAWAGLLAALPAPRNKRPARVWVNRKPLLQLAILSLVSPMLIVRAQQLVPANPQSRQPTGILHGVVVRLGTSDPIRDAQISVESSNAVNAEPQFKATTDRDGRFTIEGLPPGQYPVTAKREGYFAPDANNPGSVLSRTTATITAQQTTEVKFTIVPAGAISGLIVAPDGKPVPDALVEVMRVVYRGAGRALQTLGQSRADDRGEYRLFNLPPDNYLVAAAPRSAAGGLGIVSGTPLREILVRTFYPIVFESLNAVPVAIRPGDDLRGINLWLRKGTGFSIEGRITSQLPTPPTVSAVAGQRRTDISLLTIVPHDRNEFFDPRFSATPAVSMVAPNNGAFQLGNVRPGLQPQIVSNARRRFSIIVS